MVASRGRIGRDDTRSSLLPKNLPAAMNMTPDRDLTIPDHLPKETRDVAEALAATIRDLDNLHADYEALVKAHETPEGQPSSGES